MVFSELTIDNSNVEIGEKVVVLNKMIIRNSCVQGEPIRVPEGCVVYPKKSGSVCSFGGTKPISWEEAYRIMN